MSCSFKPGDLVRFDILHTIGVVVRTKEVEEFKDFKSDPMAPDEEIYDILVYWTDEEAFWCLDFTLEHVLS